MPLGDEADLYGVIGQHGQVDPEPLHHDFESSFRDLSEIDQLVVLYNKLDDIQTRVQTIENVVLPLQTIVQAVSKEMAEKGPVGALGILMGAMRS